MTSTTKVLPKFDLTNITFEVESKSQFLNRSPFGYSLDLQLHQIESS